MLRSNGRWKPSKKLIAAYCVWALVLPSCGPRRASVVEIPEQVRSTRHGKVAYHSVKPKDLSQHIRAVYRVSDENYRKALSEPATSSAHSPETEIAKLSALVKEHPEDQKAARALADLYRADKRFLEALELYSRQEKENPSDPEVQRALASIWDAWGNYPLALEHAAKALTPSRMTSDDWLFLGRIHLRGDNFAAAVQALRKAAELAPQDTVPLVELGEACFQRKDWDSAVTFLERALRLDGSLNDSRRQLALSLAHLKLDSLALKEFLKLEPVAAAYNDLGETQLGDHRWQDAADSFSTAVTADPSFEAAHRNLTRTEAYQPLASSVTLPSFDALPGVQRAELPHSVTPDSTPTEQASSAPRIRPLILELDGAKSDLAGEIGQTVARTDLPAPLQVVESWRPIEKVVQLPEFAIPAQGISQLEGRPTVSPPDHPTSPILSQLASGRVLIPQVETSIAIDQAPTVPVADLSVVRPVPSAPTFSFSMRDTRIPAPADPPATVWAPLESVTNPIRPFLKERIGLSGNAATTRVVPKPIWAPTPVESSAKMAEPEVPEEWLRQSAADMVDALMEVGLLVLPETSESPIPSSKPVDLWVGTPTLGSITQSRQVVPREAPAAEQPRRLKASLESSEAVDLAGAGANVLLSAISGIVRDHERMARGATLAEPRQARVPEGFPNVPSRRRAESGNSVSPADFPISSNGPRARGWTITLLATIGAAVLGAGFAYFFGLGPLAAVLIGALSGLTGGSLLALSQTPAVTAQVDPRSRSHPDATNRRST